MSKLKKRRFHWQKLPIIRTLILVWWNWSEEQATLCYRQMKVTQPRSDLPPYPIDMYPLLALPSGTLDEKGVLYNEPSGGCPGAYHPTSIAQYALAHWNAYIANGGDEHKESFMIQAYWLLTHESHLSNGAGGWPIPTVLPNYHASRPWLSALAQGSSISVLVRAYQLSGEESFLYAARRAVQTFELDILDGGVSASFGEDDLFFEEIAVYPAAHVLHGYILALFGLYDYVTLTKDTKIEALIRCSLATLHGLFEAFDTGYWTRYDLLQKRLAPWFYHSLHVTLLEALSRYSGCEHCMELAARWSGYQRRPGCRLCYLIISRAGGYYDYKLKPWLRHFAFPTTSMNGQSSLTRVCVPITAFPIPGGMRSVLSGVAQVMDNQWQMTYVTHHKGQGAEGLEIEVFGRRVGHPWQFPGVWLYCLAGWSKLFGLLRRGYAFILPQDGIFTNAFAALSGKMAGVRVVCMDHGTVSWLDDPARRLEGMEAINAYPWRRRILAGLRWVCYWPSLRLLAWIATRCTDQFLVAGDEVEDVYRKRLGVPSSQITRYAYMVDVTRFTPPDTGLRMSMREEQGLPAEAIVITMINRLAPEKGLPFALEGIALALSVLPTNVHDRVRVVIAGDGPTRSQVEADIERYGLASLCLLWGEATAADVVTLLGISDIFLYSGLRGTNYSMAVLEAMAAGCAVVASVAPRSNARLLAEGRGIAITPGDPAEIGTALARLCNDPALCHRMGQLAREYVEKYHTSEMLKRSLLRATFFEPSIVVGDVQVRQETAMANKGATL